MTLWGTPKLEMLSRQVQKIKLGQRYCRFGLVWYVLVTGSIQGSLFPPMVGGELDFDKNYPPMGERLGG